MDNTLEPRDKFITANSLRLHYLDWGNPSSIPIVLLHGLCSNAHYWDFFAPKVANEYRLLAIDQRGHGESSWAESYSPRDYLLDLEVFVGSLNLGEFMLIGHSMGGINAIIYAARHPDQVSALAIVDIAPEIDAAGVKRMERERASEPKTFSTEEEASLYMRKLEPRHSDEFIKHLTNYALMRDCRGRLTFKYDKKLLGTELRSPTWLWEYVNQIICPVSLVHGTESDMLSAEVAQTMAENLSFGSVIDIEEAGHSVPGDNPESFEAAILDFLKSIELHRD